MPNSQQAARCLFCISDKKGQGMSENETGPTNVDPAPLELSSHSLPEKLLTAIGEEAAQWLCSAKEQS